MVSNEILFLASLAGALLLSLLGLLSYLVIRKIIENRRRKLVVFSKEKMVNPIFTYINSHELSREIRSNTSIEKTAIEEALSDFSKLLEGEQERKNLQILAQAHLTEYYRRILKSRNWSQKMNALYYIEDFHMTEMENDILQMLEKKISRDEAVHGLRILASFQSKHLYKLLTEKYMDLSHFEYRNILFRLGEEGFDPYTMSLHICQEELQCAILDVIGYRKETRLLTFLEGIFFSYSGEVKLRALKAITTIGYVYDIEPYLSLSSSPNWQIRMLVAKLIGATKAEQGISILKLLLQDKSWWVRSQAGESIMAFSNGMEILTEIYKTSKDTFARDMAWEWLNKGA